MNLEDKFGCEITTTNPEAKAAWDKTIQGFLTHALTTGDTLGQTLAEDETFALAHANKGLFSLLLGRQELKQVARDALKRAKELDKENPITQRERHFIFALEHYLDGSPSKSILEMEFILKAHPHDPLAMKLSQAIRFVLGDIIGMRKSIENLLPVYTQNHPALGYIKGCYAFTLEETGEYKNAETYGRDALELAPDDAWGFHAVQHIFDMTARPQEGLEWATGRELAWVNCNNFRYHVHWHNALMMLDMEQYDQVLFLYDNDIRQDKTDDYRDIANCTSILMRLEFEGVDVGNRWEELADICSNRVDDNSLVFADLHYMMALCKKSDPASATQLLKSMQSVATHGNHNEMYATINHPGLAIAAGLEAFRDHDFNCAYICLKKAREALQTIGGSHAQRDVFERLAIEAALRAGLYKHGQELLEQRDKHRGFQDGFSLKRWAIVNKHSRDLASVI